ncbi:MAG: transcriptional regulator [Deltaproteobacteria bacterium]|nr:MAG: transcriptional regulator [Deltaproteobacteria bacterium]
MDSRELSRDIGIREKEVYAHLTHIARSLAPQRKRLIIRPSECLVCGYVFKDRKRFTPPGRCPRCRKSHLQRPAFRVS